MDHPKKDRLTELVDVAFGVSSEPSSPNDERKLGQFKKIARSLQSSHFDAPKEVIGRAKSIMPAKVRQRLSLQLVTTTLGLAGARLQSGEETQVVLEAEGTRIRIMYGREGERWNVMGKVDNGPWQAECDHSVVECGSSGQFQFTTDDVTKTSIRLYSDDREFVVPPFEELIDRV